MWSAEAEADVRTTIDTAKLKGANPFAVIVRAWLDHRPNR